MAALEYLGLTLAVVLIFAGLLVLGERRLGHRPPVRPIPVIVRPIQEPRAAPARPRPPRPRRPPAPPRGPVVALPPWW